MTVWALPEAIADVLPAEAARVEALRRALLDEFRLHGYELVIPPLLEYTDSLLTGTGRDMDLQTFKLVDQLSGRTMGIRADITPQVARIDAHLLNRAGVTRLCYAGSVLHTLPAGLTATREPMQVGAEVYGHAGIEADLEIQALVLRSLTLLGAPLAQLVLSHAGLFKALAELSGLGEEARAAVFSALQAKDAPHLNTLTAALPVALCQAWLALPNLYGDASMLDAATRVLPSDLRISAALADLRALVAAVPHGSATTLSIDLADLRGYHYHSGVMFAAYAPGLANAVVRGGRYDEVGKAFGRARPATGFTLDLREAVRLQTGAAACVGILAPLHAAEADAPLTALVAALRASGEIVVAALPGHHPLSWEPCCNRQIVKQNGQWAVEPLPHRH